MLWQEVEIFKGRRSQCDDPFRWIPNCIVVTRVVELVHPSCCGARLLMDHWSRAKKERTWRVGKGKDDQSENIFSARGMNSCVSSSWFYLICFINSFLPPFLFDMQSRFPAGLLPSQDVCWSLHKQARENMRFLWRSIRKFLSDAVRSGLSGLMPSVQQLMVSMEWFMWKVVKTSRCWHINLLRAVNVTEHWSLVRQG